MATQITQYAAQDGTKFDTPEEADAHDVAVALDKDIRTYIPLTGVEGAAAKLIAKHIQQFVAFRDSGVVPAKEVKKPRKTKATAAPAEADAKKA